MKNRHRLTVLAIAIVLSACGGASSSSLPTDLAGTPTSEVHVLSPTVMPASGGSAEADLGLHNAGAARDQLVGVSCTCATAAEIHGASAAGDAGPVDAVPLPPDKVVFFGEGGPHIVLVGLTQPLVAGDTVTLSFTFENADPTSAVASVVAAKTPSPAA
jgi:copper(I)-binding protein